jgi:uncharacterized protein
MASVFEQFFDHERFAVVGHAAKCTFPTLTYAALKARGSTVHAVDPSVDTVEGDPAFPDLAALPGPVEAVVLEVPKEETADWIDKIAAAGVTDVWIHMRRDTPEALEKAAGPGLNVRSGTCAVQYLRGGFPHNAHKLRRKMAGRW